MEILSDPPAATASDIAKPFSRRMDGDPNTVLARSTQVRALLEQSHRAGAHDPASPPLMRLWLLADQADLKDAALERTGDLRQTMAANYVAFSEYAKALDTIDPNLSRDIRPLVDLIQVADFISRNIHRTAENIGDIVRASAPALKALLLDKTRMRELDEPLAARLSWIDPIHLKKFGAVVAGALGRADAEARHLDADAAHARRLRERPETDPYHPTRLAREARKLADFIGANYNLFHWKVASNAEQAEPALLAILSDATRVRMLDPLVKTCLDGIPSFLVSETQAVIANALERIDAPERTGVAVVDRAAAGLAEKSFDPWRDVGAVIDFVALNRRHAPHVIFQNLAFASDELRGIFRDRAHIESIERHIDRKMPKVDALAVANLHEVVAVALDRGDALERSTAADAARQAHARCLETETPRAPATTVARPPVSDEVDQPSRDDDNRTGTHFRLRTLTTQGKDEDIDHASLHAALRGFLMASYATRPRVLADEQVVASYSSDAGTIPWFRDEQVEAAYLNAFASPEHQLAIRQAHRIGAFLLPNLPKSDEAIIDAHGKATPELKSLLSDPARVAELGGLIAKRSGIDPVDLKRVQTLLAQQAGAAPSAPPSQPAEIAPPLPAGSDIEQAPPEDPAEIPPELPGRPSGNGFRPAHPLPKTRPAPASVADILERVTHKTRNDGSVEYSLDGRPAFIDHGDQILMVGNADHDEQAIVAALLVAKEKYAGAFELTGDIEFKKRAIEIMIKYKIDAMLKSPEQEAMRRDIVKAEPAQPAQLASARAPATPVDLKRLLRPANAATGPSAPKLPSAPLGPPEPSAALAEPVNRLAGVVLRFGAAHYDHNPRQKMSYFVELENADGRTRTTWGVDLERVASERNLSVGDTVVLRNLGRRPVKVKQDIFDTEGKIVGSESVVSHRNTWEIDFIKRAAPAEVHDEIDQSEAANGERDHIAPSVRFVDAGAWWTDQRTIIESLSIDYAETQADLGRLGPKPPAGQGHWFNGGNPAAPPPDAARILEHHASANNEAATEASEHPKPMLAMHAIGTLPQGNFAPSLLLFKGATADYLQGFIHIGEQKQHVIAHIASGGADSKGRTILLSTMTTTPDGPNWKEIGHGGAINRGDDGREVYFDEVRFVIGDSTLVARVSDPLDNPLRQRIGFEKPRRERPRDGVVTTPTAVAPTQSIAANDKGTPDPPAARKPHRQRGASPRG